MPLRFTRILLFVFLFVCCAHTSDATIRYVKPIASGTGTGLSWANASGDLQVMINASSVGDEVWVAAGIYIPTLDFFGNSNPTDARTKTFFMKSGVNVYGGFVGTETTIGARSIKVNVSTLSGDIGTPVFNGDNSYHVVTQCISNDTDPGCILDGFTIKDGLANVPNNVQVGTAYVVHEKGAGIFAQGGAYNVYRNLCIYNNYADAAGGGCYFYGGYFLVQNDSIYSNKAYLGGGIRGEYGMDSIDKCVIYGNSAGSGGGAYFSYQSAVSNSVIFNNYADYGGGVEGGGKFSCTGSFIYNNTSRLQAGGLRIDAEGFKVVNNVFFNNTVLDGSGGGIFVNGGHGGIIINNTFYGNSVYDNLGDGSSAVWLVFGSAAVTNNIFWNNKNLRGRNREIETSPFTPSTFANNLFQADGNPLFADTSKPLGIDGIAGTADDGLRLTQCSPAVNSGATPSPAVPTDVLGNSRKGAYDIGAYEYLGTAPILPATIPGDSMFCLGGTITLTNTVTGGRWSSSDTGIASVSQSGLVHGRSMGSAIITYTTDTTGCPNSMVSKEMMVTTFIPVGPITGSDSVCTSHSIQLANTVPGGVWFSGDTLVAKVNSAGLVTGIGSGRVTISYIKGPQGCSTVASKVITVGLTPPATPISGDAAAFLCITDTVLFTNATPGGIWSTRSNGTIANVSTNGLIIPMNPGIDSLRYTITTSFGCVQQVKKMISITKPSPLAKDSIQGRDSLCIGDTLHLSHTLHSFLWDLNTRWESDNPAVAVAKPLARGMGIITGKSAGTARITYIVNEGNCVVRISKIITVVGPPAIAAINGANTVCENSTMYVTNATPSGQWKVLEPNPVFSVDTSGLITPTNLGWGTVSYIVANYMGCADTVQKQISVTPKSILSEIEGVDSICQYQKTLFTNVRPFGKWLSSDSSIASVDSNGWIYGKVSGLATISYQVINGYGCTTMVDKDVFVIGLPKVEPIAGSAIICNNSTEQYTNATKGGVWRTWSHGAYSSISQSGLLKAVYPAPDTVFYTVTDEYGCSTVVHSRVMINYPESIPINGGEKLCTGFGESFSHPVADGKWSVFNTKSRINSSGIYLSKTVGPDSVFYKYVSNGCPIQVSKNIMVNRAPDTAIVSGKRLVCQFGLLQLSSTYADGRWASASDETALIDAQGVVYGKNAGIVVLNYIRTSQDGCSSSAVYQIEVSKPNADVEQLGAKLSAVSRVHGTGYQWVDCDSNYKPIQGATKAQYEAEKNGKYAVIVRYNGCMDTSECVTVATIDEPDQLYPIVSPNPTEDMIRINTGTEIASYIKIVDEVGRTIMALQPENNISHFSLKSQKAGLYYVVFGLKEGVVTRKVLKL